MVRNVTRMNRILILHGNLEQLISSLEDTSSLQLFGKIDAGVSYLPSVIDVEMRETKTTCRQKKLGWSKRQ